MPLDTQPLSRPRRIMMLVVLLALFAGSMALAQYLVVRRGTSPELAADLSGEGFQVRQGELLPDETEALTGAVGGRPRRVDLFSWAVDGEADQEDVAGGVLGILRDVLGTSEQGEATASTLGGVAAVEQSGVATDGRFVMARGAGKDDRIVVICYSGPAPYTDADKAVFEHMCATGVKMK